LKSIPNSLFHIWNCLIFLKNSFNCFIFLLKYAYIMITKPKYDIDIILLIINFYLRCEIIWKLHSNILFYYWCLCFTCIFNFVRLFWFYKKIQCCKILRILFSNINCNFTVFNLYFSGYIKINWLTSITT
jgi:hypothetical protein